MCSDLSDDMKELRAMVYKDYEFWLGCYQSDPENWKSGILHAYRNVLSQIDGEIENLCPCHICVAMKK